MTSLPLSIKRAKLALREAKAINRALALIEAGEFKIAKEMKAEADRYGRELLALENERAA